MEVVYDGQISGAFRGFRRDALFKMRNGSYWIQAEYKYWYHYAYRPKATITRENGRHILAVAGNSVPVTRLNDVVESKIDGEFSGWEGDSQYSLVNGQVWRQSSYKYEYKYAYMPEAIVFRAGGRYMMLVAGTEAEVQREK